MAKKKKLIIWFRFFVVVVFGVRLGVHFIAFVCVEILVVESPGSVCVCFLVVQFWFDRWFGVVGSNVCLNWVRMSWFGVGLGLITLAKLRKRWVLHFCDWRREFESDGWMLWGAEVG